MKNTEKDNKASKEPSSSKMMLEGKLTPDQVENWRHVLSNMIGPYAWIIPAERVQAMHDNLQNSFPSKWGTHGMQKMQ